MALPGERGRKLNRKNVLILVFTACVAVFSWVGHAEEKKTEAQKGAVPSPVPEVEVAEVIEKAVPVYREWVASMDGIVNATILAQVEGYLIKQNYKEGDFVKKGTLLFEIDPRPFQASLDGGQGRPGQAAGGPHHRQGQSEADSASGGGECGQPAGQGQRRGSGR